MGKRILFLSESLNVGGAEKALVSMLKLLDYTKYDVTLCLISESGSFVKELDSIKGLKIKSIVSPTGNKVKALCNAIKIKALYKWLPAKITGNYLCKGYDVVVAFCEGYLTKWVAASSVPCRKVAWVHTDMESNDWPVKTGVFKKEEEGKAYLCFDNIVGVSKLVSSGMSRKYNCCGVVTIYNILDPDIRNKANCVSDMSARRSLNLVSVGRLENVKGYDILVEAMNIIVNRCGLDVSLVLVGDGSQADVLRNQIERYGLTSNIKLVGAQSNPYPYIVAGDIFVCASRHEGFNIAILEAMTLGKAVVSTDCVGPREILYNGRFGLLTEINAESLAEAICSLYADPSLIRYYSALSLQRGSDFDPDVQIGKIYSLLDSLK